MLYKTAQLSLISALITSLSACASVSEKIPTVKIERKKPSTVQTVQSTQAEFQTHTVQKAEAAMVCDNDNMRARANDRDSKNDSARVLILEEGGRSSNIIADVQVNCREYFQSADYSQTRYSNTASSYAAPAYEAPSYYAPAQVQHTPTSYSAAPQIGAPAPAPVRRTVQAQPQARAIKASAQTSKASSDGYLYNVRKGDTLYNIARINCTSVKHLSSLNNLDDARLIEVDQVLHLPATRCNSGQ